MLDDESKSRLKDEIRAELREELSRGWTWRTGTPRSGRPIPGLALIVVGLYLLLPSFGVSLPSFGKVVLPVLLILGGISLLRR
jgi:hypothetical protein